MDLPTVGWREFDEPGTMLTEQGEWTARRRRSDRRGMEAVEEDARRAHADLARNILQPGMRVYIGTTMMGSSSVSVRLVDWSVSVDDADS